MLLDAELHIYTDHKIILNVGSNTNTTNFPGNVASLSN
jgi:hypothetical protein